MPKDYGYARVSSKDQCEDRQIAALLERGLDRKNILVDKQSGKDFERPKYRRLIQKLKEGDTLFIKSIDRLGRNYEEILEQWRQITKERGVFIVVLDMPLLDTRLKEHNLVGKLIADIVLQLLSYVAQQEREFIRQRQEEGIAAAKARGVQFGRPPIERPPEFAILREQWLKQEISARAAAKILGIHHRTFKLWATEEKQEASEVIIYASSPVNNG